jgi:hypothetical protein
MFNRYAGSILLGLGAAALIVVLALLFKELWNSSTDVVGASLPLIAIGGIVLMILVLTAVAIIFSILGLANKDQAMGLPEGSIRAVISLSLIVLFAILSVYLYKTISNSPFNTVVQLTESERAQFIKDHASARDIQSEVSKDTKDRPIVAKGPDGQLLKNEDGSPKYYYNVSYRSTNTASDDFAKQLLVLLGTLMTAVTSFYLGAGMATSATAAGQNAATQTGTAAATPPTLSSANPTTYLIANSPLHLDLLGANLNIMTNAKITRAGAQLIGRNVVSNATRVSCDIDLTGATPGTWDAVVDNGAGISATLPGALTLG